VEEQRGPDGTGVEEKRGAGVIEEERGAGLEAHRANEERGAQWRADTEEGRCWRADAEEERVPAGVGK
jgi:hypothetical protein